MYKIALKNFLEGYSGRNKNIRYFFDILGNEDKRKCMYVLNIGTHKCR